MTMYCPFISTPILLTGTTSPTIHWQACIQTSCQVWDSVNNQCGALASKSIIQQTSDQDDDHGSLMTYLSNAVGIASGDTIKTTLSGGINNDVIEYLEDVLGVYDELDDTEIETDQKPRSIVMYLKEILGTYEELDDSDLDINEKNRSIVMYLKKMFGTESERDVEQSLTVFLKSMIGIKSERDAAHSLMIYLKDVIGINSEKDNASSLLVYLENILGKKTEKSSAEGTGSSILREINHVHGAHLHCKTHTCETIPTTCGKPMHCGGGSKGSPAAILMGEFMDNVDGDGNGKIYGHDFIISDDGDKPTTLVSIEGSADWVTPPLVITWSAYLAWHDDPDNVADPTI